MSVPLKTNAIITVAELDMFLRITVGNANMSNTLINIGSDFIDGYLGRQVISKDYEEFYGGNGTKMLMLKNYPITVTKVESWDTYLNSSIYTFTEHKEYQVESEKGVIRLRGGWGEGFLNYKVSYTGGWLVANVPYNIKMACAKFAGWMYNNPTLDGIKSESIGSYSITYGSDVTFNGVSLPSNILSLLAPYRNKNV